MNLNKAREKLIQMYIEALKEDKIPWQKSWDEDCRINYHNPVSKIQYHGVNNRLLDIISQVREYKDPRWLTFNQIKAKGWKLENAKGQGVPVEFWSVYNKVTKKTVTLFEYNAAIEKDPDCKEDYTIMDRTYCVFNASLVMGIPEFKLDEQPKKLKDPSPFIDNLINKMNVKYSEEGNRAFYRPLQDKVFVPKSSQFHTQYAYDSTRLHELCHATGHKSRLNRSLVNFFGSPEYAKEELRAEISASFLAQDIMVIPTKAEIDNHKAYIQSWIKTLQDNPNELFKAIKDAEKISEYVLNTGEYEKFHEIQTKNEQSKDIVLFHGSPNNFKEFEFNNIGQNNTANGFGFYLANSKELANSYSENGFIYEVSLSPKKELNYNSISLTENELKIILGNLSKEQQEDIFYNWDENLSVGKEKCIKTLLEMSSNDVEIIGDLVHQTNDIESVLNAFSKNGYTHYIKEYETTDKEYVVIDKKALKINNVINLCEVQQNEKETIEVMTREANENKLETYSGMDWKTGESLGKESQSISNISQFNQGGIADRKREAVAILKEKQTSHKDVARDTHKNEIDR